jgi:hypothetical protein
MMNTLLEWLFISPVIVANQLSVDNCLGVLTLSRCGKKTLIYSSYWNYTGASQRR